MLHLSFGRDNKKFSALQYYAPAPQTVCSIYRRSYRDVQYIVPFKRHRCVKSVSTIYIFRMNLFIIKEYI